MPDLSIIQELCKILGISLSTLLSGEDNKTDELVLKLLWVIEKLKQFGWAIVGLLICNLAEQIENLRFIKNIADETFLRGFCDGSMAGIKLVGVSIFAYGIFSYFNKENQSKSKNK